MSRVALSEKIYRHNEIREIYSRAHFYRYRIAPLVNSIWRVYKRSKTAAISRDLYAARIFYAKSSSITCTYRRRHYRSDTITSFQDVSRCFCFLEGRDIFIRSKRRTVWKFMEEKDGRREWQAKCFDEFVYFKKVSRNVWTMKYDETPLKRNVDSAKESKKKIG